MRETSNNQLQIGMLTYHEIRGVQNHPLNIHLEINLDHNLILDAGDHLPVFLLSYLHLFQLTLNSFELYQTSLPHPVFNLVSSQGNIVILE